MNDLYPIFIKLENIRILIVGGGFVALEKLTFLFKSSPQAIVTLVSPMVRDETMAFIADKEVTIINEKYTSVFLKGHQLVIATTDDKEVNVKVSKDAQKEGILVNIADTPHLCDFYMGSIVTKGHLKIAISTKGKSPTLAKRMREWLEYIIPDEIDDSLHKLNEFRNRIKGDFVLKLKRMDEITAAFIHKNG
jgi:precorrin-2 dehydrogenase / sirohydrochlorin ferrochelatase